jgi:hypothetical protein
MDGIGWGGGGGGGLGVLQVKIMIDLYKPLSRSPTLKFDGKSTLIGFKFDA